VNLTDGLDGLAIGCTVIAAGGFDRLDLREQQTIAGATYLEIQYNPSRR